MKTSFFRWLFGCPITVAVVLLFAPAVLASDIDESFSLCLANSLELPALSERVVKIEVFTVVGGNPHVPPDYTRTKPAIVLSDSQRSFFFELLGKTGRSKSSDFTQVTTDVIGCFIWTKNPTPGYIFLRNFQDGRWYLHFFSSRDSVGGFNQELGNFLWNIVKESTIQN